MADILLDKTVFDDLKNGEADARRLVEAILDGEVSAAISPMTVYELWQDRDFDRRTEIGFLSVLRFVEEAPPGIEIAKTAGLWLTKADNSIDRDAASVAMVAATASSLGIPICTRDESAFEQYRVELSPY